jgi:hypothetical protein
MLNDNFLTLPFADAANALPVEVRWEACGGFSPDSDGSPVCADCGWLAGEHTPGANVRRLPTAVPKARRPRRLAS